MQREDSEQLLYIPVKPRRQTVVNHLSSGFNLTLSQTFFQFLDLFEACFFPVITLSLCHMQAGADCILNIYRQY